MADDLGQRRKGLCLGDHVLVGIRIGFPSLAAHDPPRMASAGGIAGSRHRGAKCAVGILRIFLEHAGPAEPLLIAKLDPAKIQHRILHRACHSLAATGLLAMKKSREDTGHEMDAGA